MTRFYLTQGIEGDCVVTDHPTLEVAIDELRRQCADAPGDQLWAVSSPPDRFVLAPQRATVFRTAFAIADATAMSFSDAVAAIVNSAKEGQMYYIYGRCKGEKKFRAMDINAGVAVRNLVHATRLTRESKVKFMLVDAPSNASEWEFEARAIKSLREYQARAISSLTDPKKTTRK